jgi:CheY-like chemotaxis protein
MHVLLVDDHMDTRAFCTAVITNLRHTVTPVGSVLAAHRAAEQRPFDLLVCDIMLPDGLGYDLMRELSRHHKIRGIALTSCHRPADLERCRAAGFNHHISKPFKLNDLERKIGECSSPCAVSA